MTQTIKGLALSCLLVGLPLAAFTACGGSSNDPTEIVSALNAPQGVSIVEPDTSNVSTGSGSFPNAGSSFPVGSDYVVDAASINVFDPSIEALQTPNNILCEVSFTRFFNFVNRGPYIAQLDTSLCGAEPEETEGDGVSTVIHVFTLDVVRESNFTPQVAKLWLPLDENDVPVLINAEIVVESGPSAADLFGNFELTYAGVETGGSITNPLMSGVLASGIGESGFRFFETYGDVDVPAANPGDRARRLQLALERNETTGVGAAKILDTIRYNNGAGDSGQQIATWRVVFDDNNVKRQLGAGPIVALTRNSFTDHVYSYNLYHGVGNDLGDRVELNAGMGVRLPSGSYAWVGYHGAWAPTGESFTNGATVTAVDGGESYTVLSAPGRLKKYTRGALLLTELGTQRFEWWEAGDRYQVAYSGVEWQRVAQYNFSTNQWDAIGSPTMIDVAAAGGALFMWSPFLGGVNYADGDASVSYFQSELVTGADALFAGGTSVDLYATYQGLKGEIDQTEVDNGDIYLNTPGTVANAHKFTVSSADMTLFHDVNGDGTLMEQVGLASGVTPTMGPNEWGMQSGPLVTSTALGAMTQVGDVFDEMTYYVYETGHNPWNQYVGLVGTGNAHVVFDAPIEFLYTHATGNDINGDSTYDGQQILLSYNGPGKLFGIPGEEIDIDGDMQIDRWFPNFSLRDGTVLGDAGEYAVRAIGVEQTLTVDPGGAPQLDLTAADGLTVPPLTIYQTPQIGPRPNVTAPPAVIDGKIQ